MGHVGFSSLSSITGQQVTTKDWYWNIKLIVKNPPKIEKKGKDRMALRDRIREESLRKIVTVCNKLEKKTLSIGSSNVQDDVSRCTEETRTSQIIRITSYLDRAPEAELY